MANNRGGGVQRPNGASQGKICQFKLVLLGESAVGKSSLVLRFVKGQFHEYQESTIGGECKYTSCHYRHTLSHDRVALLVLLGHVPYCLHYIDTHCFSCRHMSSSSTKRLICVG